MKHNTIPKLELLAALTVNRFELKIYFKKHLEFRLRQSICGAIQQLLFYNGCLIVTKTRF